VDNIVLVEVVDSIEYLSDCLGSVLLSELSLLANAVEQLSTSRQLGHDVVLVLIAVSLKSFARRTDRMRTLDSNQSWNLTM
jgi:hypothetical protein